MHCVNIMLSNHSFHDLNPLTAGDEACAPGHCYGPAVREYVLIHYIVKGTGTFYARGQSYRVHPGQAFLIRPGEVTTYRADNADPWHYRWIGFDGIMSAAFSQLPAVFSISGNQFPSAYHLQNTQGLEYYLTGLLFQLYGELFAPGAPNHISRVENYIHVSYMQKIRVEEIARHLNLDRRYLTRLFHQTTGQSIQAYLVNVRMTEAAKYLKQGRSVNETAVICGYEDVSNFSRMFKKHYGISPANWKRNNSM